MAHGDRRSELVVDAGFVVVFGVMLVATAIAIGVSWGGLHWLFDTVAGLVVCAIALAGRRRPAPAATIGLVVAVLAVLVSWAADLPQEPGPAMAAALAMLVASAARSPLFISLSMVKSHLSAVRASSGSAIGSGWPRGRGRTASRSPADPTSRC